MAIIRLNTDEVFGTDSSEYEILIGAASNIRGVTGAVVEIGTRRGGSAKMIIDALVNNSDNNRSMFCIDPYGNIDYECTNLSITTHVPGTALEGDPLSTDITKMMKYDYNNNMRNRVIPSLYYYAYAAGLNFQFYCLEDWEFFARFADGVPVYDEGKKIEDKYALVFFDGPHHNEAIMAELEFFEPRTNVGSMFVFDDIWMVDHNKLVEGYLFPRGWQLHEKGNIKASYVKAL